MADSTPDFITDTSDRVAARNAAAAPLMAEKSGVKKVAAKASLGLANVVDRSSEIFADATAALMAGAVFGGIRGAMIGAVVGGVFSFLPLVSVISFPWLVGAMGLLYALHDGVGEYNRIKAHDPKRKAAGWADWIATKGSALDGPNQAAPTPIAQYHQALNHAEADHHRAEMKEHQAATQAKGTLSKSNPETVEQDMSELAQVAVQGGGASHVARENRRRGLPLSDRAPAPREKTDFREQITARRERLAQTAQEVS